MKSLPILVWNVAGGEAFSSGRKENAYVHSNGTLPIHDFFFKKRFIFSYFYRGDLLFRRRDEHEGTAACKVGKQFLEELKPERCPKKCFFLSYVIFTCLLYLVRPLREASAPAGPAAAAAAAQLAA